MKAKAVFSNTPPMRVSMRKKIKQKQIDTLIDPFPLFEAINLKVDGDPNPVTIKSNVGFSHIVRMIWHFDTGTSFLWSNFGSGGALTNGIQIVYNDKEILPIPIKSNEDILLYCYDGDPKSDVRGAPEVHFVARWSWNRILGRPEGLVIDSSREFKLVISDDLTGITEGMLILAGRRY